MLKYHWFGGETMATPRKRPRRIAKKLAARQGRKHHRIATAGGHLCLAMHLAREVGTAAAEALNRQVLAKSSRP